MEVLVTEILKNVKVKKEEAEKEIKIYNAIAKYLNEKLKSGEMKVLYSDENEFTEINVLITWRINVLEPEDAFSRLAKFVLNLKDIKKKVEELYHFYKEHLSEVV